MLKPTVQTHFQAALPKLELLFPELNESEIGALMCLVLSLSGKQGKEVFFASARMRSSHLNSARQKLGVFTVTELRMVAMTRMFFHVLTR